MEISDVQDKQPVLNWMVEISFCVFGSIQSNKKDAYEILQMTTDD